MAGFINLANLGKSLLGGLGVAQERAGVSDIYAAQKELARQQLETRGRALDAVLQGAGPEYEVFRQARKAGATAADIASMMSGPLGKSVQQSYAREAGNKIVTDVMKDPTDWGNPDKQRELQTRFLSAGLEDPSDYAKTMSTLATAGMGFKPTGTLANFLTFKKITPQQWAGMSPEDRAALRPEYEQFAHAGMSDTELKPIYHPETKTTTLDYVPKHGEPGKSAGLVTPRAGAGTQKQSEQMLQATEAGLKRLDQMIDDQGLSTSDRPMLTPLIKSWMHMKGGEEQSIAGQVSVIHANLLGMVGRAWGSRNPTFADAVTKYHIPRVGDSPARVKELIAEWLTPGGFLDQYKIAVSDEGPSTEAPAAPSTSAPAAADPDAAIMNKYRLK